MFLNFLIFAILIVTEWGTEADLVLSAIQSFSSSILTKFSMTFMSWTTVAVGMGQILYKPSVFAKTGLLPRLTRLLGFS